MESQDCKQFGNAYLKIGLNVTSKDHDLFAHCAPFLEPKNCGAGKYNEQAAESAHAEWNKFWGDRCLENENYDENLLDYAVRFNSRHIGAKK